MFPDWVGYFLLFICAILFLFNIHKAMEKYSWFRRNEELLDWARAWAGVIAGMFYLIGMVNSY